MKPLPPHVMRDINREIQERLQTLETMRELVIVKSSKRNKLYDIGLNDPKKDLILRNLARLLTGILRPRPDTDLASNVSLVDITNTTRTLWISRSSVAGSGQYVFNYSVATAPYGRLGTVLGFGNPTAPPTPTRTDYQLVSLVDTFTPSSTSLDETNWRTVITGSYVWTAGGTVRETGLYGNLCYGEGAWTLFLLCHDAINPGVDVPAGGTLSITYIIQL